MASTLQPPVAAKLRIVLLLLGGMSTALFGGLRVVAGELQLGFLDLAFSVVFFVVAYLERKSPHSSLGRLVIIGGTFVLLAFVSVSTGGLFSPAQRWLCILPLAAIVLGSSRLAWVSAVLVCALAIATWGADLPTTVPVESWTGSATFHMWSAIGMTLVVLAIGIVYDRARLGAYEALEAANVALMRANEQAEAGNKAKSRFLGNLSHELRTPLIGIVGRTQLLKTHQTSPDTLASLESICDAGQSLLEVFDGMLKHARVEGSTPVAQPSKIVTAQLAKELVATVDFVARQSNTSVRSLIEDGVAHTFLAPGGWLKQILVNLLGNALKFASGTEVCLRISQHDDLLYFHVEDRGPGVDEDKLEEIFLPFTQADADTSRSHSGVGLGLAISRDLADLMQGTLTAKNRLEGGSIFTLMLPLVRPEPASNEEICASSEVSEPLRVLLVEDNEAIRFLNHVQLESLGHHVTMAENGEKALALAAACAFDVVILDCHMPGIDGFEVARRIRVREKDDGRDPVRIVAMTADDSKDAQQQCLAAGMDAFSSKPLVPEELARLLVS